MIRVASQDARFLAMLPDIRKRAEKAFRRVNANDREELVAEVIGQAFCAYRRLVERGRESVAFATPLANYAIKHLQGGRRLCGQESRQDASSYFCQRTPLESIPDLLDDRTPPDEAAALRVDFSAWLATLRPGDRELVAFLAIGNRTKDAASQFHVSAARISQRRRELAESWQAFE